MTELYDHVFIRDSDANSMYIPTDPGLGKLTTLSAIVFSSPVFKLFRASAGVSLRGQTISCLCGDLEFSENLKMRKAFIFIS